MKNLQNFAHQEIKDLQTVKGGSIIRRGKIKRKTTLGYKVIGG